MMTHIMKTLYKFFKTAEVSQESPIYQKVKVEKYNLTLLIKFLTIKLKLYLLLIN
jgi:hypothetical protein